VPKSGWLCPFLGGGAGTQSNTKSLWPRPTSLPSSILIHPAIWPQQIWAENWGDGLCHLRGKLGPPMWPGPRPTSVPSCILIHPTVWPQYINVTDSTDRQDRHTVYTNVHFANHYLSSFLENFKLISVVFGKFSVVFSSFRLFSVVFGSFR